MSLTTQSWVALAILILAMLIAWRGLMGRQLLVTAPAAFLLYQAPNVVGVIIESSRQHIFREDWPLLVSIAYLLFVIGGLVANAATRFSPTTEIPEWRDSPIETEEGPTATRWLFVWFLVGVSLVVGFMFYRAVGYNSLLDQLRAVIEGTGVNYQEL